MTEKATVVILGAGPSGLGVALGLGAGGRREAAVTIVEKKGRPGGLAGSFTWKDHLIDYGPHRLSPNIDAIRGLAEELLGPDCLVKDTHYGFHFRAKVYHYPLRLTDWLSLASLSQLVCFGASLGVAKVRPLFARPSPESFETLITRQFGGRFYRQIAAPMAEKVWTRPDRIAPDFAIQRFAAAHPLQLLKKVLFPEQRMNPRTFLYPRKGFQQLWDRIGESVSARAALEYEARPVRLEVRDGKIVSVTIATASGERRLEGEDLVVVSTIPLMSLVPLISGFPTRRLAGRLSDVKVLSMILVAMEFDSGRVLPYRNIFFPEKDVCFNRLFEQNEYSRETVGRGRSVVVADITVARDDPSLSQDDPTIVGKVRDAMARLPYVDMSRLAATRVERVEFAYIVPDLQSRRAVADVCRELAAIPNLELLGRFAIGEYDNSDYALDAGMLLGQRLCGKISQAEYEAALPGKASRHILG